MTKDEYLDYLSDGVATEGLKDILNSPDFANKLLRTAGEALIDLVDMIAANVVVLTNNLRGYVIYKESEELMTLIIEKFDKVIEDCTYDFEKVVRGFSEKEINEGVEIFEASTLTSKTTTRIAIDEALKAIAKYDEAVKHIFDHERVKEDDKNHIILPEEMISDYKSSVNLQRKMTALHRKISSLSKKIRLSIKNIKVLENYGMSKRYAEELLTANKTEIARMGSILIAAFGKIYVKPPTSVGSSDSGDVLIPSLDQKIQKEVSKAKAMLNAV